MITSPKIEELAFRGKCRWTVFWFGYTSAGTIPVPDGGFLLLRQIMWNPFYQGDTKAAQQVNTVHQLSVAEQGSRTELLYQFRDPLHDITVNNNSHFNPSNGLTTIETWGVFKKNVCIDLLTAPDVGTAVYSLPAPFTSNAQERQTPLGYNGINIIPEVAISATELYFPTGEQRPFTGVAFGGAGVRDRVRYNSTVGRQITAVGAADPDRQMQFPLIGFGAWVFNIPVSEYLNY